MADEKRSVTPLLITGLLALLGTVAGGVVKGYWDTNLADKKFRTDLVMKALEPDAEDARINSLRFMIETRLIDDSTLRSALEKYLEDKSRTLPQFQSSGGGRPAVVVPRTDENRQRTDYDVFVCTDAAHRENAASLRDAVVFALKASGVAGEIRIAEWALYSEVPLDKLLDRTTIIVDEIESRESYKLERTLLSIPTLPPLQVVSNTGKPTPWRISVIVCPAA